ncbi:MAG TPA: hypothetical protein VFB33_14810 [Candidatus Binataceae bacterium]|nr:hypothetical protein [Candidatus Binataceae bacterium]
MSLGSSWRWLRREFAAARPVFLFFLVGFLLVLLIVKLALAQYSIEISTFGRALVGAFIAAKVVLLFDETPLGRLFAHSPRLVAVIYKTVAYGLGVLILGYIERIIDAWRARGSLGEAVRFVTEQMGAHRLLAVSLGISLVFGVYFTLAEISAYVGREELLDLFLRRPRARR